MYEVFYETETEDGVSEYVEKYPTFDEMVKFVGYMEWRNKKYPYTYIDRLIRVCEVHENASTVIRGAERLRTVLVVLHESDYRSHVDAYLKQRQDKEDATQKALDEAKKFQERKKREEELWEQVEATSSIFD